MTLERESDTHSQEKRMTYGKKRRMVALKRSHLREREALEQRAGTGMALSEQDNARLKLLREMYD